MAVITERLNGDKALLEHTSLLGQIFGKVTVTKGVNFQLHGQIFGELILLPGSEAFVHGVVNGDVRNKGGSLSIFGVVNGTDTTEDGTTRIDPRAQVFRTAP